MKKYTVRQGDTVRMIAQRELGSAELWIDIVSLNNLSYPYVSDIPGTGIAVPGDELIIPVDSSIEIQEETSFGTDLHLSTDKFNLTLASGGDLTVGVDGDYSLVAEMDCLKQDLSHRKMTPLGTLPYHPTYGSELTTIVGSKKDVNWKIKAQLETERTLRCDPRISDVRDVAVEDIPTGVKIDYTAVAKGVIFRAGGVEGEEI
jgi:phage baseplate assembly protein W